MKTKIIVSVLVMLLAFAAGWALFRLVTPGSSEPELYELEDEAAQHRGYYRIIEYLQLSDDQHDDFIRHENEYRQQLTRLTDEINQLEASVLSGLGEETPDTLLLKDYARQIGRLQGELKQTTIDHFLNLRTLCTEEQQERLRTLFLHMESRRGQGQGRSFPGRGQGRQRYGRQVQNGQSGQ